MENNVGELIRKMEQDYQNGSTTISKYVEFNLCENINKVDAYLNSKHTSGEEDSMGREKPFFNIVTAARNIWFRATDIDRKNIRIKASKGSNYIMAFLATILLQEYMNKEAFGQFLNDWGLCLANYGSSVLKFIKKEDGLHCEVIPWNRLICDAVDFEANPKIEKLWFTPAQLKKNKLFDQEYVEQILKSKGEQSRKTLDRVQKDNKSEYIEVYEVHGEMPLSYLTDKDKDDNTYVQQMHIICFTEAKERGKFDDYTLYKGRESKDPYIITHLIKMDGRAQSIGAVEFLFESQWMVNHTVKAIKDQLDLASKLVFQTSDAAFVGRNVLTAIESGDILIHSINQPLTQIANNSHDITALQNFSAQWQILAKDITSTPDAMRGNTMPSGTAYRQVALLQQQSSSLFEMMIENKALDIERMLREYIIPYLKTKMDTSEEISAILEDHQIKTLDSFYIPNEATKEVNERIIKKVLSPNPQDIVTPQEQMLMQQEAEQEIQGGLDQLGNQRFIKPSEVSNKTWKNLLKDLEWEVEVEVSGEATDKQATLQTLTTLFQSMVNPGTSNFVNTPEGRILWNRILEEAGGISPIEIQSLPKPAMPVGGGSVAEQIQPMQPIQQQ